MPSHVQVPPAGPERTAAESRVRDLLATAAAAFPACPAEACAWLHERRTDLCGLSPAALAWIGPESAALAHRLLLARHRPR